MPKAEQRFRGYGAAAGSRAEGDGVGMTGQLNEEHGVIERLLDLALRVEQLGHGPEEGNEPHVGPSGHDVVLGECRFGLVKGAACNECQPEKTGTETDPGRISSA